MKKFLSILYLFVVLVTVLFVIATAVNFVIFVGGWKDFSWSILYGTLISLAVSGLVHMFWNLYLDKNN